MHRVNFRISRRTRIVMAIILAMAFSILWGAVFLDGDTVCAAEKTSNAAPNITGRAALHDLENAFTSIADQVLPSVVSITSKRTVQGNSQPNDGFFFPFNIPGQPGAPQKRQESSYGSGVIVRANGYILTNDHVVGGADKVTVKLKDGREFEGKVSRDPKGDLAIIKIDATNLPAANLGDSSKVKPGQFAIAMGSPFELEQTLTVGFVSAIKRQEVASDGDEARFYPNLIQTDASINPGNSGGPLVNIDGEVIGINTLIRSGGNPMMGGGGNIGIGFAIPIDTAKFVLNQLIEYGKVTRGYLGMTPTDLTPKMQDRYGVKEGAFVKTVEVSSPADTATLQVEDIITQFDGKKIRNEIDLRDAIAATAPGKQVQVLLMRAKKEQTLKVTVGEAPETTASSGESDKPADQKMGFSVANITPDLADKFKLDSGIKGVVVTKVDRNSPAAQEGLNPGIVVSSVNSAPVKNVSEFDAATKNLKSGDVVQLVVRTNEQRGFVEFTLE